MNLTNVEQRIIEIIREEKPFEVVEIHKDKLGKQDTYLVIRTQKVLISPEGSQGLKIR